jgi:hypothetical protein
MAGGEGDQIYLELVGQPATGGEQLQGKRIDLAVDVFD